MLPGDADTVALTVVEYDRLERAIADGKRLALRRRGSEFIVIPERLRLENSREVVTTRHPSTGHRMDILVDEIDGIEVVE